MNKRIFHGYISSRPINGERAAQHVQNLVVRSYAERADLPLRLSAVEYTMPGCYLMLEDILGQLGKIQGIVFYTIHMLPQRSDYRRAVLQRIIDSDGEFHAALEGISIRDAVGIAKLEDTFSVARLMRHALDPRISSTLIEAVSHG